MPVSSCFSCCLQLLSHHDDDDSHGPKHCNSYVLHSHNVECLFLSVERLYEHDDLNLDGLEDVYQLQVAEAENQNAERELLAVEDILPDDEPRVFEGKFLYLFLNNSSYNL